MSCPRPSREALDLCQSQRQAAPDCPSSGLWRCPFDNVRPWKLQQSPNRKLMTQMLLPVLPQLSFWCPAYSLLPSFFLNHCAFLNWLPNNKNLFSWVSSSSSPPPPRLFSLPSLLLPSFQFFTHSCWEQLFINFRTVLNLNSSDAGDIQESVFNSKYLRPWKVCFFMYF